MEAFGPKFRLENGVVTKIERLLGIRPQLQGSAPAVSENGMSLSRRESPGKPLRVRGIEFRHQLVTVRSNNFHDYPGRFRTKAAAYPFYSAAMGSGLDRNANDSRAFVWDERRNDLPAEAGSLVA
jgi:hypothetical protein